MNFASSWAISRREVSKETADRFATWVDKRDPEDKIPLAELFDEWISEMWRGLLSK